MRLWRSIWLAMMLTGLLVPPLAAQTAVPAAPIPAAPIPAAPIPAVPPAIAPAKPALLPAQPAPAATRPVLPFTEDLRLSADAVTSAAVVIAVASLLLPSVGLGSLVPFEPLLLPSLAGGIAAAALARDIGWDYVDRIGAFAVGVAGGAVLGLGSLGVISEAALRNVGALGTAIAYAADRALRRQQAELTAAAVD